MYFFYYVDCDAVMADDPNCDEGGGIDGDTSAVASLTGFLFGNIDEKGELEEDFLDEVS